MPVLNIAMVGSDALATEIAKIYCDEYKQVFYPEVVDAVERQLRLRLKQHADNFYKSYS